MSLLRRSFPFISAATVSLAVAAALLTTLTRQNPTSPALRQSHVSPALVPSKSQAVARFARVPLHFAPNRGQASSDVRFLARGPGYTIGLGATDVRLSLRGKDGLAPIRLVLQGANPSADLIPEQPLPGKINYYLGSGHSRWITNIPTSAAVRAEGVYPGIDLVYYGNQNQLEHDFVLAPGVNPSVVRWTVEGADTLKVDAAGNLLLTRNHGEVRFEKPVVFQEVSGHRLEVEGRYKLLASNEVGFEVGEHDSARQLVIDPVLTYSGYLAGSDADSVKAVALDSSNSLYVTGLTFSNDFPTTDSTVQSGNADVFVTKLDPSGNFVYSTYIGGTDYDQANGIAVASGGVAFVTGITYSAADDPTTPLVSEGFPVTTGARQLVNMGNGDAFLVKLSSTGTIANATLFGGTGMDDGRGVALDTSGRPTIAGLAFSTDLSLPVSPAPAQPANSGFDDAFVARFDQNLATLVFGTYFGGDDLDEADDLTVDSIGNTYVVGQTYGAIPTPPTAIVTNFGDAPDPAIFLAKFNPTGGVTNLTVVNSSQNSGSPTFDLPHAVALDASRNVYIVGETNSPKFAPLRAVQPAIGGGYDAFILKLDSSLRTISIFSYLGGSDNDFGRDVAVGADGSIYLTGNTDSVDFPTFQPLSSFFSAGFNDAFVTKLTPSGDTFVYSTYLGGEGVDTGNSVAVDSLGAAYIGGETFSTAFPEVSAPPATVANPADSSQSGGFVAKLTNDPLPVLNVAATVATGSEPSSPITFTITRGGAPTTSALTVSYSLSGTAASGVDYTYPGGSVTIPASQTSATVTVTPIDDTLAESSETVVLTLSPSINYTLGSTASATGTILDDDSQTVVSISASSPTGSEPSAPVVFTVTRSGAGNAAPLTVSYTLTGSATNGVDYSSPSGSVIIPANQASATITITPIDDSAAESSETVIATLSASTNYTLGSATSATGTILDNDSVVTVSSAVSTGSEPNSPLTFTVARSGSDNTAALVVSYTLSGTASNGVDYVDPGTTVTIPANQASATVTVTPMDDSLVEGSETVTLTISPSVIYTVGANSSATGTILDDETQTIVNVSTAIATGSEPSSPVTFTVTRSGGSNASALTVPFTLSGTATNGVDYDSPGSSVIIPANQTSVTITISPIDDTLTEGSETVIVTVSPTVDYNVGSTPSATGTILDDDARVVVNVSAAIANGSEPSSPVTFTVTRGGGSNASALTVPFTLSGTATNGVDYSSPGNSVIIPAGQNSATIAINPIDDNLAEGSETVVVTLSSSPDFAIGGNASATGTIMDNDNVVNVSTAVATGSEPSSPLTFTVTRGGTSNASALTVSYTLSGTATSGADYVAPSGSVTIPANQASVTITITPKDDSLVEGTETVVLTLSSSVNYSVGSSSSATGTILDDDGQTDLSVTGTDAPDPSTVGGSLTDTFTVRNNSTKETQNIVLTVNLPSSLKFTSSVPQSVTPPPATPIVFNLERLAAGATYQFLVNSIPQVAGVSQVTAMVSSGSNDTNGANNSVTLQTTINQVLPSVSVTAVLTEATEGTGTASYRFTRTGPTTGSLTVKYSLGGTATAGTDYVTPVPAEITIPAGSATAIVGIATVDDNLFEGTETLTLTVLGGQNTYTVGSPSTGTVNIADNDPAPVVTISATVATGAEPASALQFTVARNNSSTSSELIVAYAVTGSAVNGSDYSTLPGTVKIPSGSSSTTITVTPINDSTVENDETVTLTIKSDPKYAIGSPNSATGIIQDNDTPTTVSVNPVLNNKVEGSVPQTITDPGFEGIVEFTRTGPTVGDLIVFFTTSGTATAGSDYQPVVGQATIPAGQRSVDVGFKTLDDDLFEGQETIIVTVSPASGYTPLAAAKSTTINILDNEQPPTITITATDNIGAEPSNAVVFSIRRAVPAGQTTNNPLTVFYTVSGTATPGSDYNTLSGQLVIPSGATTGTLTVTPKDDTVIENDETVTITLSTPAGSLYAVGSPDVATGTIQDNDTPVKVSVAATVSGRPENFVAIDTQTGVTFLATGAGQFTFTRNGPTTSALNVKYTVGGTATPGTDYETLSGTATIPAGSASVNVPYNFLTDFIYEGNETVIVTVVAQSGYAVGTPASATGTISDDETPPILTLTANDPTASEPNSIGQFAVKRTVTDSRQLVGDLTFRYSIGGTAANGTDYVRLTGTATIKSGSDTGFVTVTPIDDTVRENNETVVLTLLADSAGFYKLGTPIAGTVTIQDNEPPFVTIAATDSSASETAGNPGTFTVTRASNTAAALTVLYSVSGTATSGTDYNTLSGSVTIPAGAASATITVTPREDTVKEPTETVVATLKTSSAYVLGTSTTATVNILDNENTVSLLPTDVDASEPGSNRATITVSLNAPAATNLTVLYSVAGTAVNGSDYQTLSGQVVIPVGSQSTTVVVTPINDTIKEPTETVILTLKSNTAYGIAGGSVTATITDNDGGL